MGHRLPFVEHEERVALALKDLVESVGVALIEDLRPRVGLEEAASQFGEGDLNAAEPLDRNASGDVGELSCQMDIESIGKPQTNHR